MVGYEDLLTGEFEYDRFSELCNRAFKYGEFECINEILTLSLPLANITYYQSIRKYDDDYSAKEDLIQDALDSLYRDMKLQWDKYIHVDNYYEYIKRVFRNTMLGSLGKYHHYGTQVEYDPDLHGGTYDVNYDDIDLVTAKVLEETILETTAELLSHRLKRKKLLLDLFERLYYMKDDPTQLNARLRKYSMHGVGTTTIEFYKSRVQYMYQLAASYHRDMLKGVVDPMKSYETIMARIRTDEYETLSILYGDTPLPEVYAELGQDATMKLLNIIGGSTVKFPNSQEVADTLLGRTVYQLADGRIENLSSVSEVYDLPYSTLKRIFNKHISNMMRRDSKVNEST